MLTNTFTKDEQNPDLRVRKPIAAGTFYPAEEDRLRETVGRFLQEAATNILSTKKPFENIQNLRAILVPHAGYIYSGQIAGLAYREVNKAKSGEFKKVVLLGPSHRVYLDKVVEDDNNFWETPLGRVDVGKIKISEGESSILEVNKKPHEVEHCLEVQLPFLQVSLKKFSILPLLVGDVNIKEASGFLQDLLDQETLFVVSSDLSHYFSYEIAQKLDSETIKSIESLDIEGNINACGEIPIRILMDFARLKGWHAHLLGKANSGDATGDRSRVVGYASFAFYT